MSVLQKKRGFCADVLLWGKHINVEWEEKIPSNSDYLSWYEHRIKLAILGIVYFTTTVIMITSSDPTVLTDTWS